MPERNCPCGEPVPAPAKGGRPARYCSTACRRNREYEVRRENALLLRAQKEWQTASLRAATELFGADAWARRAAWWLAEVHRLEDHLFQGLILDDVEGDEVAP